MNHREILFAAVEKDPLEQPVLADTPTEVIHDNTDRLPTDPPPNEPGRLCFLQAADSPKHLGRLGHFEVLELIGRGGMGIVLAAHDSRLNRRVAIKVLSPWRDHRNLFWPRGAPLAILQSGAELRGVPAKDIADWRRLWNSSDEDALEGQILYQGGDLHDRGKTSPDHLQPADFRLRPDSAGYRAGSDGRSLGADAHLVGPGEAYQRWKKMAAYQQWLEETEESIAEHRSIPSGTTSGR